MSNDCIAGSGIQFIAETYFVKLCADQFFGFQLIAGSGSFFKGEVYIFFLINTCSSLSDEANKIKPLNIERA